MATTLEELLASLQPTEQDRRDQRMQGLISAGLSLMGAPKGRELQAAGQAGLLGLDTYRQGMGDLRKDKMSNLALRKLAFDMDQQQRAQAEQEQLRALASANYQPPQAGSPAMGPPSPSGEMQPAVAPTPGGFNHAGYVAGLYGAGQPQAALKHAQDSAKVGKKLKDTKTLMNNGQRVTVNFYDDGSHEILPYAPDMEKAHFLDTGQTVGAVDPFTGKPIDGGGVYQKQVTPGDQLSAQTSVRGQDLSAQTAMRGQNMVDRRAGESATAAGPIIETAQGYARVGKDNTVTPIVTGGAQLQPKPTGAVVQQIAQNNVTMTKIDQALTLADKYPNAFGLKNLAGDMVMQRVDPSGVTARAMIADIAGQKIHDRSGAAVTVGEAARLKPYVPNSTDNAETIKKKLVLFKREYRTMQDELAGGRPLAAVASTATAVASGDWSIKEVK